MQSSQALKCQKPTLAKGLSWYARKAAWVNGLARRMKIGHVCDFGLAMFDINYNNRRMISSKFMGSIEFRHKA
ncbi:hypothetical protein [Methyloglobulus morosus]|uniref:hypothetical protein n=1 Tax=Methyloglobulus morosus TaxID=1410681 RepID=UPI000406C2DD|nr:hypothetical protein [Methyloglobulus morosus]